MSNQRPGKTFVAGDHESNFALNLLTEVQQYQKKKGRQKFEIEVKHKNGFKEVYIKGYEYTGKVLY